MIHVSPLAAPPAQATPAQVEAAPAGHLFIERAQALDPAFVVTAATASTIAAICTRLGGLPLALELAAARLRVLSPAALLARLDHPQAILTGGALDLPMRQQSLQASLDWSYALLPAEAQTLFRRLAAVPAGAGLAAITTICNSTGDLGPDLLALLETLVAHHLLDVAPGPGGEPRFQMPALVLAYAAAHLAADPLARTIQHRAATLTSAPAPTAGRDVLHPAAASLTAPTLLPIGEPGRESRLLARLVPRPYPGADDATTHIARLRQGPLPPSLAPSARSAHPTGSGLVPDPGRLPSLSGSLIRQPPPTYSQAPPGAASTRAPTRLTQRSRRAPPR